MLRDLWPRTKHVASTYTGTFIVVMFLNQLVFFGFCLNPICLVAAMPHVLLITVAVGSWINKVNNWGAGDVDETPPVKPPRSSIVEKPRAEPSGVANDEPLALVVPERPKQPAMRRRRRDNTALYGSLSNELVGNWTGGYTCDQHTKSSKRVGTNKQGHAVYETSRSEMGQLVYDLKYSGDFTTVPKITKLVRDQIMIEGFDYIIPAPASKMRMKQPVDAVAHALGQSIGVPVLEGFLEKSGQSELKGISDPSERKKALRDAIDVVGDENIAGMSVLLIDDLYRSGATLRACCRALGEANVGQVWVLTLTKTRRHQ